MTISCLDEHFHFLIKSNVNLVHDYRGIVWFLPARGGAGEAGAAGVFGDAGGVVAAGGVF